MNSDGSKRLCPKRRSMWPCATSPLTTDRGRSCSRWEQKNCRGLNCSPFSSAAVPHAKMPRIGLAKAVTIKAALELGNRRVNETMTTAKTFNNAETTYRFMKHKIANLTHEECWALMLNNKSRLLKLARLSQGGRTSTLVDVRILLKQAIMAEAICVILVHNHPSGGLSPSRDDDRLTESVKSALQAVSIQLLDHVIIADGGYYSYVENGRL